MTPLETLVLVLGIPFFIIEISQLIQLVRSQKKLTSIWERALADPEYAGAVVSNAIFGFMEQFNEDEEKQKAFFGFIQNCAVSGAVAIREYFSGSADGAGVQLPKRHPAKPFEGLINQLAPSLIEGFLGKAKKGAAKAAEGALEGW